MTLLVARNLRTEYRGVAAVDGVDLEVAAGETVGLVGESGCGKSSLGKTLLRLVPAASGQVLLDGTDLLPLAARALVPHRRRMQMVFQDASASLNPRQTVRALFGNAAEGAWHPGPDGPHPRHAGPRGTAPLGACTVAARIQRRPEAAHRHCARPGLRPDLLVFDEPVSALDLSIQAGILNLLVELRQAFGLAYLFISHDLSVIRYIADRVLVMYLGPHRRKCCAWRPVRGTAAPVYAGAARFHSGRRAAGAGAGRAAASRSRVPVSEPLPGRHPPLRVR